MQLSSLCSGSHQFPHFMETAAQEHAAKPHGHHECTQNHVTDRETEGFLAQGPRIGRSGGLACGCHAEYNKVTPSATCLNHHGTRCQSPHQGCANEKKDHSHDPKTSFKSLLPFSITCLRQQCPAFPLISDSFASWRLLKQAWKRQQQKLHQNEHVLVTLPLLPHENGAKQED